MLHRIRALSRTFRHTNLAFAGFWLTYLAIIAAALITLAGCGGGDHESEHLNNLPVNCQSNPAQCR